MVVDRKHSPKADVTRQLPGLERGRGFKKLITYPSKIFHHPHAVSDVVSDGMRNTVFPCCQSGADRLDPAPMRSCDERANDTKSHSERSDSHLFQERRPCFAPIDPPTGHCCDPQNSDCFLPALVFSAINHSIENRKTARVPETKFPYTFGAEIPSRIVGKQALSSLSVLYHDKGGCNILRDEMGARLPGQTPYRTAGKSSSSSPRVILVNHSTKNRERKAFSYVPVKIYLRREDCHAL